MQKIISLLLILLLTACTVPQTSAPTQATTPDEIATQVSVLLTTMPTATVQMPVTTNTTAPTSETEAATTPTAAATSEPSQTPTTATITPTVGSSPTPSATATEVEEEPDWRDPLDNGDNFYLYDNGNTRVSHENGHLVLTGVSATGWLGWSLTFGRQPSNFRLEGVFQPQTCSGGDIYGLVFRATSANAGYFFGVTCDGRYSLSARNFDDGSSKILVEATESAHIRQGSNTTNVLGVEANGSTIRLYINDQLLQEVTDTTYTSGYFGALVAANNTPGFTVWLDEISLWNLP